METVYYVRCTLEGILRTLCWYSTRQEAERFIEKTGGTLTDGYGKECPLYIEEQEEVLF